MQFPKKHFEGKEYDFSHLKPIWVNVPLGADGSPKLAIHVSYSCHCFSEEFDPLIHQEHHRYTFGDEMRAFDLPRYSCSLQLPSLIGALLTGKVYRANNDNYTYVAHIIFEELNQPYSVFFHLKKDKASDGVAVKLRMYVQSAYLSPLKASAGSQSWRFKSLAGGLAGIFETKAKKAKPKKKKTP